MLDLDPIFADDGLLPTQFRTVAGHARPEHALWQAVFAQAVEDLRGGAHLNREKSRKRAQMIAEARAWTRPRCGRPWSSPLGRERKSPLRVLS